MTLLFALMAFLSNFFFGYQTANFLWQLMLILKSFSSSHCYHLDYSSSCSLSSSNSSCSVSSISCVSSLISSVSDSLLCILKMYVAYTSLIINDVISKQSQED